MTEVNNNPIDYYGEYDLGFSFLYTHRIPAKEFRKPYRWVNFHPGPLPEYRGRDLAYHAIMEGADKFGATIHYMDEYYDTGEIIEVVHFPIKPSDTAGDLVERSHAELERLFVKWVPMLLNGKVSSVPQGEGRYFRKSVIDDRIILNENQLRQIRALTVYPRYLPKVIIGGKYYKIAPE
jgi:methionyl-tRNA formyltransferase